MNEIETIFQKSTSDETWFSNDTIKLPNRAMSFGDGLFETMVFEDGDIRFFDKHIKRLSNGMKILGLELGSINSPEILGFLTDQFPTGRKRIRWNVFRSGKGKYTPENSEVMQTLEVSPFISPPSVKQKVDVSLQIQLFPTSWSSFKSLNSLPYILANQERKVRGLDEIILLDYRGFISESGASNIFWIKDEMVYTPSLSCSCINGVSRQVILEHLDKNSIPYIEGEYKIGELDEASQVFISNCTGISYLEKFNQKKFSIGPPLFLQEIFD